VDAQTSEEDSMLNNDRTVTLTAAQWVRVHSILKADAERPLPWWRRWPFADRSCLAHRRIERQAAATLAAAIAKQARI
jgi:hypothetical protein